MGSRTWRWTPMRQKQQTTQARSEDVQNNVTGNLKDDDTSPEQGGTDVGLVTGDFKVLQDRSGERDTDVA